MASLKLFIGLAFVIASCYCVTAQRLPFVYEYFANTTTRTGLVPANQKFTLNGREIRIISGAIHYFRVHPALWRDRLRKLRAIGANTVETYIPWNLHEPQKDVYDFGDGNWDLSSFLDVRRFITMAQEEDLLVLIRPGPYICAEWDFGGFPSWLQRFPNLTVRYHEPQYLERVKLYYKKLLPLFTDLQFTRGGPILAFQIENEYGTYGQRSHEYLTVVKNLFDANGLNESIYFTSDNGFPDDGWQGSLSGVLQTANMRDTPERLYSRLREIQPDMPLMTMEFWSGWYNYWGDGGQAGTWPEAFAEAFEDMLKWNASVNFYMFHGGTNFGFMAGGGTLGNEPYIAADITSYDYDAPLTEGGDYSEKYLLARDLIEKYALPKLYRPEMPAESLKVAYGNIPVTKYLSYSDLIDRVPSSSKVNLEHAVSMENLPINNDSGQSYGYIIYRKTLTINPGQEVLYKGSWPRDIAFLIVDGDQITSRDANDYWMNSIREFPLTVTQAGNHTIDLMVEAISRINSGAPWDFTQQKGIAPIHESKIEINGNEATELEIIALEFTNRWVKTLTGFKDIGNSGAREQTPVLLEATLNIDGIPADTWLDMKDWNKGIVFVNGFNVGRYWRIGPQQTLYVPAPLLKRGQNQILVFEQVKAHNEVVFTDKPNLGIPPRP